MKITHSAELVIPGYHAIKLNDNTTIGDIFDIIDQAELSFSDRLDVRVNLDFDFDEEDQVEEISEMATQRNKDTITLSYEIPKNIAFTNKFQDRIRREIPDVIESVYPNLYSVGSFTFAEDLPSQMKLSIQIKALTPDAVKNMSYLDENVNYIVEDIVEYYK